MFNRITFTNVLVKIRWHNYMNLVNVFQFSSILTTMQELAYTSLAMPLSLPTVQRRVMANTDCSHRTKIKPRNETYDAGFHCLIIWGKRENIQSSRSLYAYINLSNHNKYTQPFFYHLSALTPLTSLHHFLICTLSFFI